MKPYRIDRFKRRPSDAHLLTPPDQRPYCVTLEADKYCHNPYGGGPVFGVIAEHFNLRPIAQSARPAIKDIEDVLKANGLADQMHTEEQPSDRTIRVHILKHVRLSPKLLANLTPLQRQRMSSQPRPSSQSSQ